MFTSLPGNTTHTACGRRHERNMVLEQHAGPVPLASLIMLDRPGRTHPLLLVCWEPPPNFEWSRWCRVQQTPQIHMIGRNRDCPLICSWSSSGAKPPPLLRTGLWAAALASELFKVTTTHGGVHRWRPTTYAQRQKTQRFPVMLDRPGRTHSLLSVCWEPLLNFKWSRWCRVQQTS